MPNLRDKVCEHLIRCLGYCYGIPYGCYLEVALTHPIYPYSIVEYDLLFQFFNGLLVLVMVPSTAYCFNHPGLVLLRQSLYYFLLFLSRRPHFCVSNEPVNLSPVRCLLILTCLVGDHVLTIL